MAIPKTNAKMSEMGPDCGLGNVPITDLVLRRRAGNWSGSGNASTADLRGSIASNQILKGEYSSRDPQKLDVTNWNLYDPKNVSDPNRRIVSQNAATGKFTYELRHLGGGADVVLQALEFGMLPSSGKFKVAFGYAIHNGSRSYFRIEVIGSKTNFLQGGNKVYTYHDIPAYSTYTTEELNVDPEYRYLTISMGLGFPGRPSAEYVSGSIENGAKAYIV